MISEEKKRVLDLFARGRKLYKLMQFEEAQKYFQQALETYQNGMSDGKVLLTFGTNTTADTTDKKSA